MPSLCDAVLFELLAVRDCDLMARPNRKIGFLGPILFAQRPLGYLLVSQRA